MKKNNLFKHFKNSPEIIKLAGMYYVCFPLILRKVEDILHERGIDICHETVRSWWNRFGSILANEVRQHQAGKHSNCRWDIDEVFVKISGEKLYPLTGR